MHLKLAELHFLISSNEPSIIALKEVGLTPSVYDAEIYLNKFTVFWVDRVQTRRGGGGGVSLCIMSSLKPIRLQLDIGTPNRSKLIGCRFSTFLSQTTTLVVYRSSNSSSSGDALVLQAS